MGIILALISLGFSLNSIVLCHLFSLVTQLTFPLLILIFCHHSFSYSLFSPLHLGHGRGWVVKGDIRYSEADFHKNAESESNSLYQWRTAWVCISDKYLGHNPIFEFCQVRNYRIWWKSWYVYRRQDTITWKKLQWNYFCVEQSFLK